MTWTRAEQIDYHLGLGNLVMPLRVRIAETIARYLDDEMVEWINQNVEFREAISVMIPTAGLPRYLILLSTRAKPFTIMHELAHAYLGHVEHFGGEDPLRQEKEANALARDWMTEGDKRKARKAGSKMKMVKEDDAFPSAEIGPFPPLDSARRGETDSPWKFQDPHKAAIAPKDRCPWPGYPG